ncbi:MAG TPA: hypothetical protein PK543_00040 [Candidatus Saccharibacteria bacterium]|nr:hypothetical protein [Candidatus Saccharibacteria bacterium]
MSQELFKTRCTKGHLVIYDDKVSVELNSLGVDNSETIQRNQITGVEIKTTHSSLMGFGGVAQILINSTGDKSIEVKMVKLKDARHIKSLLSE